MEVKGRTMIYLNYSGIFGQRTEIASGIKGVRNDGDGLVLQITRYVHYK